MPIIGSTNIVNNRVQLPMEDTGNPLDSGNRSTAIPPAPRQELIEMEQIFRDGSIPAVKIRDLSTDVDVSIGGWSFDATFSSSDADTVAWTTGTLTVSGSDGVLATYSIDAGNTGNMSARTYIYLDIGTSETVLQTTTTAATAVGLGKILICVAKNETGGATFQAFGGAGGVFILGDKIVANSITANQLSTSLLYAGAITIDEDGCIKSGQTAYNTGSGWWIGDVGGVKKFSIGDGTIGNSLTWNGTQLTVNGYTFVYNDKFGDGSDGDVTITTNTTLTRDMFYDNLTISNQITVSDQSYTTEGTFLEGYAYYTGTNETWATAKTNAGGGYSNSDGNLKVGVLTGTTEDGYNKMWRAGISFNTSGLPDDLASITGAKLRLYVNDRSDNLSQSFRLTRGVASSIDANADYGTLDTNVTAFSDTDVTIASATVGSWVEFTLNAAAIAAISKTGDTYMGVLLVSDVTNTAPTWASATEGSVTFDSVDGTNKPQLLITYLTNAAPILYPNGYRIFAAGTMDVQSNATISANGNNGGNGTDGGNGTNEGKNIEGGSGASGGAAKGYSVPGSVAGSAGGIGGGGHYREAGSPSNAVAGTAGVAYRSIGGTGGVAGAGGSAYNRTEAFNAGGGAGAAGAATTVYNTPRCGYSSYYLFDPPSYLIYGGTGAGGGGGGGGGSANGIYACCGGSGGGGGGGGASGNEICIFAKTLIVNGTVSANGGTGGNGGKGGDGWTQNTAAYGDAGGGGGGGGGGAGGAILLVYSSLSGSGSFSVTGGTKGTGGAYGTGSSPLGKNGNVGGDGSNGVAGNIYYIQV